MDVDDYASRHGQFFTQWLPPLLVEVARPGAIIDLGCGDGATIWALSRRGLLGTTTWAVDLSAARVENAVATAASVTGIVADAASVPLPDGSADGVICSQVIEHVVDDNALVEEIARLLRPGGWWYVGSVMRGPHAWWVYRVDGIRRLDPTHVREYDSEDAFRAVVDHPALDVSAVRRVASPLVVYESVEVVFGGCRGARAVGERGATAAGPGDS